MIIYDSGKSTRDGKPQVSLLRKIYDYLMAVILFLTGFLKMHFVDRALPFEGSKSC